MKAELMRLRRGFSLVELMVVVAIVAILSAVALPLYQEHVLKSRRQEAKATLLRLAQLEERFYSGNNTYQATLGTLLGVGGGAIYSGERPTDSTGKYEITLTPGTGAASCTLITCGYVLTAKPNGSYSDPKCGNFTLSSTGVRTYTGTGTTRDCW